ncbi:carbohydrate ABC transporter permease [Streptomyces sp. NPDC049627]|uniref:carbohydrate ABC transporter permease n=1 Tax=Streptomyces sp. NPDC049627 TaxID=3365595 RepID=UPI0037A364B2
MTATQLPRVAAPQGRARRRRRPSPSRAALPLLAPFCLLFGVFFLLPIGYAIHESLYAVRRSGLGFGTPERVFAGFDNYAKVFDDGIFLSGVGRLLLFGFVQVPVMLGLALLLALLLDGTAARCKPFFRLVYFLPYAVPGVIAAIVWAFLYTPQISPFGLDLLADDVVLGSIGNIVTWTWTGFNMLVIYSALQAVPRDIYEAAAIDGAGPLRIAWQIKIPMVRPSLALTAVFSVIGTLQLFNEPRVLSDVTANVPKDYTPLMWSLQVALDRNDYALGSAIAVVLAVLTGGLSLLFLRLSSWLTTRGAR